jgi:hypothetical protein
MRHAESSVNFDAYPDLVEQDGPNVDRTESEDIVAMPVAIHTYAATHRDLSRDMPRMVGMPVALTMRLNQTQWEAIEEAYLNDNTEYCQVRLSEVYAGIYDRPTVHGSANSLTMNRIKQWKNRIF